MHWESTDPTRWNSCIAFQLLKWKLNGLSAMAAVVRWGTLSNTFPWKSLELSNTANTARFASLKRSIKQLQNDYSKIKVTNPRVREEKKLTFCDG